jgi:endonuclease YncB( thermonuclease family)
VSSATVVAMLICFLVVGVLAVALVSACGGEPDAEPAPEPADSSAVVDTGASETAPATTGARPRGTRAVVVVVVDGDTLELRNGKRVRLVQIDAPEAGENECYSRRATEALRELIPEDGEVRLVADPKLDRRDRFDRLLRYVFVGKINVNLELVKQGAASVWFVGGDRGRYAKRLLRTAEAAKAEEVGLWGACPGTELDPSRGVVATQ